jgi:FkbM family methyltransferase
MLDEIYIFGAGIQGQIFLQVFQSLGLPVSGFIDDYANTNSQIDVPIFRVANINTKCATVYISVGLISSKIKAHLLSQGFENVFDFTQSVQMHPAIIQAMKVHSLWYSDKPEDTLNRDGIALFRALLSDEKSQRLLDQIVAFRTDFEAEDYIIPDTNTQYFPHDIDIFASIDEVRFVDAGAFNGDTVTSLIQACTQRHIPFEYAACFEPDHKNLKALKSKVAALHYNDAPPHVFVYPTGVWHRSEVLQFSAGQSASSHVSIGPKTGSSSQSIFGLSIDDCLFNAAPNFIKMDIEGAERNALIGAKQSITTYRPVLAICLYHRPRDLWEIPLFIHELVQDYDMHLRVYGDMLLETVLYCLPKPVDPAAFPKTQ